MMRVPGMGMVCGPVAGMRRIRPLPHRPSVYVHELTPGIVANPTGVERERRIAQQRGRDTVDAEVNRLCDNVLRVLRGIGRPAGAQFIIGLLGPVA